MLWTGWEALLPPLPQCSCGLQVNAMKLSCDPDRVSYTVQCQQKEMLCLPKYIISCESLKIPMKYANNALLCNTRTNMRHNLNLCLPCFWTLSCTSAT